MAITKPTIKYLAGLREAIRQREEYRDQLDKLAELGKSEHWAAIKARLRSAIESTEAAVWNHLYAAECQDPATELADMKLRAGARQMAERIIGEVEKPDEFISQVLNEINALRSKASAAAETLKELNQEAVK